MIVRQTSLFAKTVKKLHANQKKDLDTAISELMDSPVLGELKKGDLAGVRVFNFRMNNQETLLAYSWEEDMRMLNLLVLGMHENFYRDLK